MIEFDRLRLLLETSRYLSAAQLRSRARAVALRRLRRITRARFSPTPAATLAPHEPLWQGLPAAAADARHAAEAHRIAAGEFRFLNRDVVYAAGPQWHDPDVPQLWRYHLHYFDYVLPLALQAAAGDRREAFATFRALVESWMRGNVRMTGDG